MLLNYFSTVDISASILAGRELEDVDVCHDQPAAGSSERDSNKLEVCDEGWCA